jgi:hypothetical protein
MTNAARKPEPEVTIIHPVADVDDWLSKTILATCSNAKKPSSFWKQRAEIRIEVGAAISWGAS